MFDKRQTSRVGAAEKIAIAKRMREAAQAKISQAAGVQQHFAIPVTIVFALAVVLAVIITDGGIAINTGLRLTGFPWFDGLITGKNIPTLAEGGDIQRAFYMFTRGFAFFLFAGIAPLVAYVFTGIFDQRGLNPFIAMWGSILLLAILYFLFIG